MTTQIGPRLWFGGGRRYFGCRVSRLTVNARLLWEPRDLWIGVYHREVVNVSGGRFWSREIFVCLLPCLPLLVSIDWRLRTQEAGR